MTMPYSEKQIAEWAEEAADKIRGMHPQMTINALKSAALTLSAAVRKETREECARVCEEWGYSQHDFGPPAEGKIFSGLTTFDNRDVPKQAAIAAAIRNLQEREEGE